MCSKHYQRWKRGSYEPGFDVERSYPIGLDEQFEAHTVRDGECLIWTGKKNNGGYGRVSVSRHARMLVHRVAYMRAHGEIPNGAVIDHTCHNEAARAGLCSGGSTCPHRMCVEPGHLRAVTQSENLSASGLVGGRRERGNNA